MHALVMDVVFIALTIALFALTLALIRWFGRM